MKEIKNALFLHSLMDRNKAEKKKIDDQHHTRTQMSFANSPISCMTFG